ncbi:MAG: hypothetical protein HZA50_05015 [Planctomycetes bacterium]|nr:hypothetical protein [Planctomycetota bacterium]
MSKRTRLIFLVIMILAVGVLGAVVGYKLAIRHEYRPMQGLLDKLLAPVPKPVTGKLLADIEREHNASGPYIKDRNKQYILYTIKDVLIEWPANGKTPEAVSVIRQYLDWFGKICISEGIDVYIANTGNTIGAMEVPLKQEDGGFYFSSFPEPYALGLCAIGPGYRIEIAARFYDYDGAKNYPVLAESFGMSPNPVRGQRILHLRIFLQADGFTEPGKFPSKSHTFAASQPATSPS